MTTIYTDTICLHSVGVSNPWNFKHNVHVAVDPSSGNYYTGLPDEWRKVLSYPQGKLHPKFARPLPADVPTDFSESLNLLRITLNNPSRSTFNNPRDPGHLSTTLSVTPDMRMGDILDRVCAKMRLEPTSCALALPGDSNGKPLSLDDTVEDLHGKDNLVLVTL
ncbi:hypothetical protein B0H11DRAFT_1114522 [Mycena galericulata]|nr:hypothetical protein B0H11DRAFT_1114522 [Mycena galericulata]